MLSFVALVLGVCLSTAWGAEDLIFPPGFKFGVASSAYQIEGAWNVSDKGESIWDRFSHKNRSHVADGSDGDVACDSYHLWKEDIDLVDQLGVQFYRISISWARLLPKGFTNRISEDGKSYYNNLIDGLLEKGIEPVVTLYHWDLPQRLQDLGGWTNPFISTWFSEYARIAFSLFGNRVKTWITINEPWILCEIPYYLGILAPGIISPFGSQLCTKHVLLAHAKAWRVYDEEFRPKYHGRISIASHLTWMEPATPQDEETAELVRQYQGGRYSHPIFSKEGGWPPTLEKTLAEYSTKQGVQYKKLPALSKAEIELIKGTYDFYGLNYYSSLLVRRARAGEALRPWPIGDAPELNAKIEIPANWTVPASEIFTVHPVGIRKQFAWIKNNYGNIPIFITENGYPSKAGLQDDDRIKYHRDYLTQILLAIKEDGANVTAYTAWSLLDSFEWLYGYTIKYGLYEVDFSSPKRTRTPRASSIYYSSIVKKRSLDVPGNVTLSMSPKTSKPEDDHKMIIISGLIGAFIIAVIAASAGWRMRQKAQAEKRKKRVAGMAGGGNVEGTKTVNETDRVSGNTVDEAAIPLTA